VSGHAVAIDAPGTVCAFQTRHCSTMIDGAGGFDRHHPIPKEMGGADRQVYLVLCPTHHRRQHALIRLHCELDSYELPRLHRWHAPEEPRALPTVGGSSTAVRACSGTSRQHGSATPRSR
jgi:hypothetical protein